ncbi:S-adenosyl-L-methionine-dependent methyltransferase [Xylogone sp. PMI_703]|nr:S-adenosyl-L-methionine-dependent methyltransferase [Xylogone sp. PMI_703]
MSSSSPSSSFPPPPSAAVPAPAQQQQQDQQYQHQQEHPQQQYQQLSQGHGQTSPKSPPKSPKSPKSPQRPGPAPGTAVAPPPQLNAPDTVEAADDDTAWLDEDLEDDSDGNGDDSDRDSAYASEEMSAYSASLTSSIRNHILENGMQYHAFHADSTFYPFPNDENEQNRDDIKHAMTVMLCGGRLYFAPIGQNPQSILDLGTGTGIWAIEMADRFPSATVEGVDLSAIQPTFVPPNLKFIVDDIEGEWVYPPNSIDYVHCRHVAQTIKNKPLLLQRALEALRPGGYFEFQEILYYPYCDDGTMTDPYPFKDWVDLLNQGIANLGGDNYGAAKLATQMRDAGFANVSETVLKLPFGTWPKTKVHKRAGLYWRVAISDGLRNISSRIFTVGLGWKMEELDVYLVDVRKSLTDTSKHVYFPLYVVYGQKPLS